MSWFDCETGTSLITPTPRISTILLLSQSSSSSPKTILVYNLRTDSIINVIAWRFTPDVCTEIIVTTLSYRYQYTQHNHYPQDVSDRRCFIIEAMFYFIISLTKHPKMTRATSNDDDSILSSSYLTNVLETSILH